MATGRPQAQPVGCQDKELPLEHIKPISPSTWTPESGVWGTRVGPGGNWEREDQ